MAAPTKVTATINVGAAPHGLTTRWTYTVPAGRFCILEHRFLKVARAAAAAPAGVVFLRIVYTPSGAGATVIMEVNFTNNTVDYHESLLAVGEMRMKAGDVLACDSIDVSTGGTASYLGSVVGTEYDA